MSRIDYGFEQWSVESFFNQESLCVLIYGETVYIFSYTYVLHANIFSPFMMWEYIYRICCISEFFIDLTCNVGCKGKRNSKKIQGVK